MNYTDLVKLSVYELQSLYNSSKDEAYKKVLHKAILEVQGSDILASLLTGPAVIRRYY